MYCKNCGREIKDDAAECPFCGHRTNFVQTVFCTNCGKLISPQADICPHCLKSTPKGRAKYNMIHTSGEPKTGIGVLLGLFLGIIGLIIGLLLYPANSIERSTFIKGWVGAFIGYIVVAIIIYVAAIGCVASSGYYY